LYRQQTTALAVLTDLIRDSQTAGLPQLTWTMADNGALTGEAHGLPRTADEQRTAITRWARHVGTQVAEHPCNDGRVSLIAPLHHRGERVGILRAELSPKDDYLDA
jgi:hypothetical protein